MRLLPFILLILIFSCKNEEKVKTIDFFNELNLKKWNQGTDSFIRSKCEKSIFEFYKKDSIRDKYITKRGDTIRTFENHLNLYLKNRENLFKKLKGEVSLFSEHTDTLVVTEIYLDIYDPRISYIVANNEMYQSLMFYFKSNTFEKVDTLDFSHRIHNYDSIISKKPQCLNEVQGILNSLSFETVFYLDKEKNIVYDLKWAYFGSAIID